MFSSMLNNVDFTNSEKPSSLFSAAPPRNATDDDDNDVQPPSMENLIAKLSAKDRLRNSGIPTPRVTPASKVARGGNQHRSSNQVGKSSANNAKTSNTVKRPRASNTQTGIHSFFSKAAKIESKQRPEPPVENKAQDNKIEDLEENRDQNRSKKSILSSLLSRNESSNLKESSSIQAFLAPPENDQTSNPPMETSEESANGNNAKSQTPEIDVEEANRRLLNRQFFGARNLHNGPTCLHKNLLTKLHARSTRNSNRNRYHDSGYHGMRNNIHARWRECTTVELDLGMSHGEITCMEFDAEGVLLAVSDSRGCIRIYDFDEVNAADMVTKQRRKSNAGGLKRKVPPFITFSTGNTVRISSLQWNPWNDDMLAVTFL